VEALGVLTQIGVMAVKVLASTFSGGGAERRFANSCAIAYHDL